LIEKYSAPPTILPSPSSLLALSLTLNFCLQAFLRIGKLGASPCSYVEKMKGQVLCFSLRLVLEIRSFFDEKGNDKEPLSLADVGL